MIKIVKNEWDSYLFQQNIGYVVVSWETIRCNTTVLNTIKQGIQNFNFVVAKIPFGREEISKLFTDLGFRLIESCVTYKLTNKKNNISVGLNNQCDIMITNDECLAEKCAKLSHDMFTDSRFHRDPLIPVEVAKKSRSAWILKGIGDKWGQLVVAKIREDIAGFILFENLKDENRIIMHTVGVLDSFQGKKVGKTMISYLLNKTNADYYTVTTQTLNYSACALYASMGFRISNGYYTYHYSSQNKVL